MQSSIPGPRRLVHVERIAIRWGDMDAMGHVNNTVYFRYMEQARIGWFDALVPREEAWKSTAIVIANASCNFKRHQRVDRKSTRLNSSHTVISYAVFCLKKKKQNSY